MKKILISAIALTAILQTTAANAEVYGQASLYGTQLQSDTVEFNNGAKSSYDSDFGGGAGLSVGYKLTNIVRTEAEVAYRTSDVESAGIDGEFESVAVLGNVIVDIPTNTALTPYIGAGAGYANVSDSEVDDNVLAYQGMAGLSYAVSEKTDLVAGYKYFATATPEFDLGAGFKGKAPYKTHNVELGLRVKF